MSRDRVHWERLALQEYQQYLGKTLLFKWVVLHDDFDGGQTHDIYFDPPAAFVLVETPLQDLKNWCDDYLDPYWNLKPTEETRKLLLEKYPTLNPDSAWFYGTSYGPEGVDVPYAELP